MKMSLQNRIGLVLAAVVGVSVAALAFNHTSQAAGNAPGDLSVSCGPSQQAMVQRTGSGESAQVHVSCVETSALQQEVRYAPQPTGQPVPVTYAPAAQAVAPAVMYAATAPALAPTPAVMYAATAPAPAQAVMYAPQPVAHPAPVARAATAPRARQVDREPSLKKRLLIIGGTSGAGAGIGALIGGRKGALIGAAIGGGGAAIVDQVKH